MSRYMIAFAILFGLSGVALDWTDNAVNYILPLNIISISLLVCYVVLDYFDMENASNLISKDSIRFLKDQLEDRDAEIVKYKDMTSQMSRLSSLGEVAGSMGHEINNQLSVMEGWADQLTNIREREDKLSVEYIENAGAKIQKHVRKLSQLTKAIRNYVRMTNEDDMEIASVDDLIDEVVSIAGPKLKKNNVILKKFIEGEKLNIECNSLEVSQVLLNLVSNSVDAIGDDPSPWIQIRVVEDYDYLFISVTDSGDGIPPMVAHKMMDPYYTTKESGKGTGIGLAISQSIMKSHQGELSYDSNFKHTRFVLKLPKRQSVGHEDAG